MENKGYLDGVPQTFDEKIFDLLLGNADIDGDLAIQDIINVYGVANLGTIANALSMAMKNKIETTTDEPLQTAKRLELIAKLRKYSDCTPRFDNELFAMELHYNDGKSDLDAPAQYNGNISWMKWRVNTGNTRLSQAYGYQYDKLNRLTKATYGEFELDKPCVVNKDRYNETITYDDYRGNIRKIQRNGLLGNGTYGVIDNIAMTYTGNKLNTITELGDLTKGFKGSNGNVTYDNRGNMTFDASRGLSVFYNFLDLPTSISNSMGRIEFTYDASGNLLTKTVTYNAVPSPAPTTTDYVKGIEYVNDVMTSIYHDEGRLVQVNGTWQSEYVIKDHLGNARVTFRDVDGNGFITASDITQEANYYPFGMQMEGAWSPAAAVRIPYLYNGIEHVSDLGLDINTALFRTLDPALGRWWQIDPKAESFVGMTPYNSMGNNPVIGVDPNGDFVVETVLACALVGGIVNSAIQGLSGKINSDKDFYTAFGMGALNGALVGMGAGSLSAGINQTLIGAASSLLPSFSIGNGSFNFSISPSFMLGTSGFSIGANISMGVNVGKFHVGFGVGVSSYTNNYSTGGTPLSGMEVRSSFLAGVSGKDASFALGVNSFESGTSSQQTGIIRLGSNRWSLSYENDGAPFDQAGLIPKGSDGYRTAAVSLNYADPDYGDFSIGFKLYTGCRDMSNKVATLSGQGEAPYGWVGNPEINDYRLGALFAGHNGYKAGWNSDGIRHYIQNKGAHQLLMPQAWIPRMSLSRPFAEYQTSSLFTHW